METKLEIGDTVKVISSICHNNSYKKFGDTNKPSLHQGDLYLIEDVDYDGKYCSGYTVLVGGRAFGSEGVELIQKSELNRMREIIYKD